MADLEFSVRLYVDCSKTVFFTTARNQVACQRDITGKELFIHDIAFLNNLLLYCSYFAKNIRIKLELIVFCFTPTIIESYDAITVKGEAFVSRAWSLKFKARYIHSRPGNWVNKSFDILFLFV